MADIYLENDSIRIGMNLHGAELVSIVKKSSGNEYMWCGNAAYWGRVSPVLFPFVGKLKDQSYKYDGTIYENVPQHGYARDCDFLVDEKTNDTIWFVLEPDQVFTSHYPFKFRLRIGYRIEGSSVHVMWTVINNDDKAMHFSIGAHPAFACDGGLSNWSLNLHTNKAQIESGILSSKGTLTATPKSIPLDNGILALSDQLFDQDALIIDGKDIHTIDLINNSGEKRISVRFDTPLFGIWSPVGKSAPFVCIEPWFGRSDRDSFTGQLSEREYGNTIEPGHSFNKEYVIDIF